MLRRTYIFLLLIKRRLFRKSLHFEAADLLVIIKKNGKMSSPFSRPGFEPWFFPNTEFLLINYTISDEWKSFQFKFAKFSKIIWKSEIDGILNN